MITFMVYRNGEAARVHYSEMALAQALREEGRLCTGSMVNPYHRRCFFGVLEGWRLVNGKPEPTRIMDEGSRKRLWPVYMAGVHFNGTDEDRCALLAGMVEHAD